MMIFCRIFENMALLGLLSVLLGFFTEVFKQHAISNMKIIVIFGTLIHTAKIGTKHKFVTEEVDIILSRQLFLMTQATYI